jgi:hypothetical protein
MNVTAFLHLIIILNHYVWLKSNIYHRSVLAFENFEKSRSDKLKQFNFDEIKKIFDNKQKTQKATARTKSKKRMDTKSNSKNKNSVNC